MQKKIFQYALENAVKYNGKADLNAVLGKVFSEFKDIDKKKIVEEAKEVIKKVNSMPLENQKEELKKLTPEKKEKPIKEKPKLPELEKPHKNVVMRFAPNPNGPLSLGHSRPALWNYLLVKKYKGKYILRFDDTDPKVKVPIKDAYKWIQEDLKFLGVNPDKIIIQSKRLKIYYKYAEELIKKDGAYVCTCEVNKWRKLTYNQTPCPCRKFPVNEQLERWKKMFTNYKEGEAVLRIKTDISLSNPALRDWAAFRIADKSEHPLDKKSKVWPLLNFASAIDDHEFKVTHILRGIDLMSSDDKQRLLYNYFNWEYPKTMYHGKLLVSGIKSTTEARELIKEKKLTGWDDPRLGTLKALRRRGFTSEAITRLIKEAGIDKSDINVSFDTLSAFNREVIDKKTDRYFSVLNPEKIKIKKAPELKVKIEKHPDFPKKGYRVFNTNNEFYIEDKLEKNKMYRLMHLFNFKNNEFHSEEHKKELNAKLIHWLPVSKDLVNVEITMPDNSKARGLAEKGLKNTKINEIIQFERKFFAKLEKKQKNKLNFIYSHR